MYMTLVMLKDFCYNAVVQGAYFKNSLASILNLNLPPQRRVAVVATIYLLIELLNPSPQNYYVHPSVQAAVFLSIVGGIRMILSIPCR